PHSAVMPSIRCAQSRLSAHGRGCGRSCAVTGSHTICPASILGQLSVLSIDKTMGRETMRSQITNSYLKHMALRDILLPSIDDDDSIWVLLSKENDEILLLLKMLEESPSERAIVG
ncbi:hypothetical protein B0H10DRAFT_2073126, partial [Mycena sp. CBHHK59/15]